MSSVRVINLFRVVWFFLLNIYIARKVSEFECLVSDGVIFRGYSGKDAGAISKIYSELNDGAKFSFVQRSLYKLIGGRFFIVVELENELGVREVIGMNMYYLNGRDFNENTIHEGFVGVRPEFSGRGIATQMRKIAIKKFSGSGFSGISTRISLANKSSFVSARKLGFIPVEEYRDDVTGEDRYYMILQF